MYGHRHHDNGRSSNRGIESILRKLDIGTDVIIETDYNYYWQDAKFINYDPEANLAFFSLPERGTAPPFYFPASTLTIDASKIRSIRGY
jgi:hypothetical protein